MNVSQLARDLCCNYDRGTCLGILFKKDKGTVDGNMAGKKCWISKSRCKYFENIVIPGITDKHIKYNLYKPYILKYNLHKEDNYKP